ncbi:MAG: isochorismatase family protein [Hyphomicrobiales bacterium]|nr:isochorismatase family protein [Hyphomicrobiales bacterium]
MRTIDRDRTTLLVIDFQQRLMPAIDGASGVLVNAGRLIEAAKRLGVPAVVTEQNPKGLGPTVPELAVEGLPTLAKMEFDAARADGFFELLPKDRPDILVAGCEAHVCVLQTVLGLIDAGHAVYVVRDAIGSRRAESKEAAIERMRRHGAEIVTTEMALFEWLGTAADSHFREIAALIR